MKQKFKKPTNMPVFIVSRLTICKLNYFYIPSLLFSHVLANFIFTCKTRTKKHKFLQIRAAEDDKFRSSHLEVFSIKCVRRNSPKVTEKHFSRVSFLPKLQVLGLQLY